MKRHRLVWLGSAGLLVLVGLAVVIFLRQRSQTARFEAALQRLSEQGRLDLTFGPPVPETKAEQDELDRLTTALETRLPIDLGGLAPLVPLPENQFRPLWKKPLGVAGIKPWDWAKLSEAIQGAETEVHNLVRTLTNDRPRSWLTMTNWNEPQPSFLPMRARTHQLKLLAQMALHEGRWAAAAETIDAQLAEAQRFRRDGLLAHTMIRCAMVGLAHANLHSSLGEAEFSEASLERLQRRLEGMNWLEALQDSLAAERASTLRSTAHLLTLSARERADWLLGSGQSNWSYWKGWLTGRHRLGPDEGLALVRLWEEMVAAAQNGADDPVALRNLPGTLDNLVTNAHPHLGFLELWVPRYSKSAGSLIQAEVHRRQCVLRIAAERFRLHHGRYPNRTEELVPGYLAAVPIDPMDGAPLRYRLEKDGKPSIRSVGWDGVDQDGVGAVGRDWEKSPDWAWPRLAPVSSGSDSP